MIKKKKSSMDRRKKLRLTNEVIYLETPIDKKNKLKKKGWRNKIIERKKVEDDKIRD